MIESLKREGKYYHLVVCSASQGSAPESQWGWGGGRAGGWAGGTTSVSCGGGQAGTHHSLAGH